MAEFQTFDLARVFQAGEAIKNMRRQEKSDAIQDRYLEYRTKQGEADLKRQERADEIVLGKEKAQQIAVKSAQILQAPDAKSYVEQYEPDLVKNLTANGIDWATLDNDRIKGYVTAMQNRANQELGVAPAAPVTAQEVGGFQTLQQGGKVLASAVPPKPETITPYQQAQLDIQQQRLGIDRQKAAASAPPGGITPYQQAQLDLQRDKLEAAKSKSSGVSKTTEGEKAAANYLSRMESAESLLGSGYQPSTKDFMAAGRLMSAQGGLMSSLANQWLSDEGKSYYQAANDWVRAKLRKESGASIPADEMMQEIKTYFPVPGDSAQVIEQKRQARLTANEGMRTMAAGAAPKKPGAPTRIASDEDYAALPSGTQYIAPDGTTRTKR